MRYTTPPAFRRALEDRLKAHADGDGARLARDRKRVVFDRFLARLVEVAPEGWVLKGGVALDLRLEGRARSTKDIDLGWRAEEDELLDVLLDAASCGNPTRNSGLVSPHPDLARSKLSRTNP